MTEPARVTAGGPAPQDPETPPLGRPVALDAERSARQDEGVTVTAGRTPQHEVVRDRDPLWRAHRGLHASWKLAPSQVLGGENG